MLSYIKKSNPFFFQKRWIQKEFNSDCQAYIRWNYNNPDIKTKSALECKILRQGHILEKGMSLRNPRKKFGVAKAEQLLEYIQEFIDAGYNIADSSAVQNVLCIVREYLAFHRERDFIPENVEKQFEKFASEIKNYDGKGGIKPATLEQIMVQAHGEFPEFFSSRHSVRQFADTPVSLDTLNKAVQLAMHAPSACNRQSCSVYFYQDQATNASLGKFIAGNTGFQDDVPNYLVITSNLSAFYDAPERNQIYIDGGIMAMALVESLHYYGIASCILQNGETRERDSELRGICSNIPENEKIILFIAIGNYREHFQYAVSQRKNLEDVLKIR